MILDEGISAEEEYDNQESDDKISNEKHLAIVELNQKFKIFGNFTLFTTKVGSFLSLYALNMTLFDIRLINT